MIDNSIDSLLAGFQPLARTWLHIVRTDLGLNAKILETKRDIARQEEVFKAKSSKVKYGWHNVGLAFDFAMFNLENQYITDGRHPYYAKGGIIGEALGMIWGGRWTDPPDAGHLEYHPAFTIDDVRRVNGEAGRVAELLERGRKDMLLT